jgi:hypothetical protein
LSLKADLPLRILEHFEPEQTWTLEPGDMLYLPPRWAHDGVAVGECVTASIGFRAPARDEIGAGVLQRMLDGCEDPCGGPLYRDPAQRATDQPARIPAAMVEFAADAVRRLVEAPRSLECALGEWLSEPKPKVWFDEGRELPQRAALVLDRRTRTLVAARSVVFGEYRFDCTTGRLTHGMAVLYLTSSEIDCLKILAAAAGTAISREQIAATLGDVGNARSVDVQINRLRRKIEIDPMITHVLPLERINDAFDLMHKGESIRSVVVF